MQTEQLSETQIIIDPRNKLPDMPQNRMAILNFGGDPDRVSSKYAPTNDLSAVKMLNDHGWFIDQYKQVRSHNPDKAQFSTYLDTYKHESGLTIPGEGAITLLQKGSHDGTKQLVFNLGFFRYICENGLVTGTALFEPAQIRHSGDNPNHVGEIADSIITLAPRVFDKIDALRKIELSPTQVLDFASEALNLRFGKEDRPIEPSEIIVPWRHSDIGNSAWKVLNVVQERLIKKTDLVGKTKDNKRRAISKINNIDLDLKINTGLWNLMDSFVNVN